MNTLLEPIASSAYLGYLGNRAACEYAEPTRSSFQASHTMSSSLLGNESKSLRRRPIAPAKPPMRIAGIYRIRRAKVSGNTSN